VAAWGEPSRTTILHGDAEIARFVAGAPVLTDDFAPVDQLLGR